ERASELGDSLPLRFTQRAPAGSSCRARVADRRERTQNDLGERLPGALGAEPFRTVEGGRVRGSFDRVRQDEQRGLRVRKRTQLRPSRREEVREEPGRSRAQVVDDAASPGDRYVLDELTVDARIEPRRVDQRVEDVVHDE